MLANKYQDYMFGLLKKVIDEIGPRPPCSEAEKKLGCLLVEEWRPVCDRVDAEPFICSPTALAGSLYIMVLLYFATIILYWFFPPLALAIAIVNCSVPFLEAFQFREAIDFLFPRRQGENVIGTIQPKGKLAQRVIVSAHMDSAYESTLLYYLKTTAIIIEFIGIIGLITAFGACLAKTLAYYNVFSNEAALTGVGIALAAISLIAMSILFSTSRKPVPGAIDNMSGVSVIAGLGRYLGEAKRSEDWFPQRTEVVLLGTSSEEAWIRGAKRYVKSHLKELKAIPTYVLNLDGVYDETLLTVIKREVFNVVKYDPELVKTAQEVAVSHSWPITTMLYPIPGTTDASPFVLSGIHAAHLGCSDSYRLPPHYHTRNDTYDQLRPESLSVMLQMVIDMIERIDKS